MRRKVPDAHAEWTRGIRSGGVKEYIGIRSLMKAGRQQLEADAGDRERETGTES